jgi:hypothetical protein
LDLLGAKYRRNRLLMARERWAFNRWRRDSTLSGLAV